MRDRSLLATFTNHRQYLPVASLVMKSFSTYYFLPSFPTFFLLPFFLPPFLPSHLPPSLLFIPFFHGFLPKTHLLTVLWDRDTNKWMKQPLSSGSSSHRQTNNRSLVGWTPADSGCLAMGEGALKVGNW